MIIFKKEKHVVKLCLGHADKVLECCEASATAVRHWIRSETDEAKRYHDTVGRLEREADDIRREIGDALFEGAYLPQIREDLFRLIQSVDHVANKCEDVWEFFATQGPEVPDEYRDEFIELIDLNVQVVTALHRALRLYFKPKGKLKNMREGLEAIYRDETKVDKIQWDLTHRIFRSELELARKTQLQRALAAISSVSDFSEDVADELDIVSMKSVI